MSDGRREQILEAAARVFAERGYHEAGIADIATDLGIGHGTFYRYFKNKKDIVSQAVDLAVRRINDTILEEDPESSGNLAEHRAQIQRIYLRLFTLQDQHPHLIRFLYRQATDPARLAVALDGFLAYTSRLINNGIHKGFLRPDIDVDIAGQALVAIMFDVMRRSATTPMSIELRQRWLATGTRMMLEGLQTR
ncbi:MAG TPA: TetR/AcrR family transcriptional regulator [Actinophytocola sp.]|uniref:TetR/AcrR family transcriptional regulator n=1 Tax=Actinophytocola sp. TaxID=1872138 RepID=UPI002DDCBC03|nr:TetR/AcrR family transcriptional regulator [Actinophytocola sp.]HEV2778361.1 TetR/AcrR family transcriptional regulator [Actinophytocola sp.]